MSALVITISGDSLQELKEKVSKLALELGSESPKMGSSPVSTDEAPAAEKKGKKGGKVSEAPLSNGHANGTTPLFEESAPSEEVKMVSREQAMTAPQQLNGKKGLPVSVEILKKFKAARFSELKDGDLAAFVQACSVAAAS